MFSFRDKKIVITGGTSGLGKALALKLHHQGAKVLVIARRPQLIEELTREALGVQGLVGDISDKNQIYELAGQVHHRLRDVDILFNVASYLGHTPLRLLVDTDCEDIERTLQTNLLGAFRLTKALLPSMLIRQSGLVVNISSDAAVNAYARWGGYAISKAALDHMARIFDTELREQGVRFLSLDPGDMNTPMHFAAIPDADPESLRNPADSAEKILQLIQSQDFTKIRRAI
jgi:NAD(P)-dependent dehydrogenase (short-subunit alcohol dehydrogenase family)